MAASAFDVKDKKNLFLITVIVVCLSSIYLFYDSVWVEFQENKLRLVNEQKKAQSELDKINEQKPRVPMLEAELQRAELEFEKLKEMFPEDENVPLRLQDLYAVVRASGVNIQSFKPTTSQTQEFYVENNYSFTVNAGYHMLGYLFAEIANFNYPTTINNLKLSRSNNLNVEVKKAEDHGWEPLTMGVSFDLTTFSSRKK